MHQYITADKDTLKVMYECIKRTEHCEAKGTLKQFAKSADGKLASTDVAHVEGEGKLNIEFSEGGLVYIDYSGDTTFKDRFRRLFKIMVTRNSERFLNGEEKNHSLLADFYVVDLKEKMVYILSFQDPIFVSSENNELSMAVKDEDFIFAKETLEIEEIEYEMSLDEENEVDEEQEEKIEKGDLLSNDDILDTSNYIEF